ncbi:hypothetical protein [Catellatospora tritici]|uniref:hypothetical protein n=1 Tax=Catellatospora tritici TaxID=2851566 RepID=UPI001C2DA06E|nr:hypothetical protein [Catellatospora tritici]MBV1855778.1 hypothetical protein [Catellatospora tritici]
MSDAWKVELLRRDWRQYAASGRAEDVRDGILELMVADDESAADDAVSMIHSAMADQNGVFEVAIAGVQVLLLALGSAGNAIQDRGILSAIEYVCGTGLDPHADAASTVGQVNKMVASGLWSFYSLLEHSDEEVASSALGLAMWADFDRNRAQVILASIADSDNPLSETAKLISGQFWWRSRLAPEAS